MYKVDIVYICQMDFNHRSYREIICSEPEFSLLQIGLDPHQRLFK